MTQSDVTIMLDDRVRLMSAVLAGTTYPRASQAIKRYHAHPHARATLKYLHEEGLTHHPAVTEMQRLLDNGVSLEELFSVALHADFDQQTYQGTAPAWLDPMWLAQVGAFAMAADLQAFWKSPLQARAWEDALTQTVNIFRPVVIKPFLKPFFGDVSDQLVVIPNIGFPADREIGVRTADRLISIVPPPLAWGASNPWPFDEETNITQSYRAALAEYCRILLSQYLRENADKVAQASRKDLPVTPQLRERYPSWVDQFTALFISGVVSIYLEDHFSKPEAHAFELMERKVHGMTLLGATISVMRRYISGYGSRYTSLADFLTIFPTQLRVAKTIVGS